MYEITLAIVRVLNIFSLFYEPTFVNLIRSCHRVKASRATASPFSVAAADV